MLQDARSLLDRDDADLQLAGKGRKGADLFAGRCGKDTSAQGISRIADDLPLTD
ncbi:hypothetical protein [Sphingobium scionense]|uniref:hypothetical protein n=1 Tax=Sphingobium scionense TaxID=1404341 RepID=UPI0031B5FD29